MALDAGDATGYLDALDRFYTIIMAIADNRALQETHLGLMGPVRRLRRIAMVRGGRMRLVQPVRAYSRRDRSSVSRRPGTDARATTRRRWMYWSERLIEGVARHARANWPSLPQKGEDHGDVEFTCHAAGPVEQG
ncbi:FCD domain-containing protein [Cupriavidus sp. SIMBA_020]|uniref:FCD domain-containing protein n=1 Tax=Cupriavidus sp. SIMBA_020 TaxID=3085766 RepID=UPI00397958A9